MCVKGNSIKVQATNNISPSTHWVFLAWPKWELQISDFNSYKGLFMNEEEGSE